MDEAAPPGRVRMRLAEQPADGLLSPERAGRGFEAPRDEDAAGGYQPIRRPLPARTPRIRARDEDRLQLRPRPRRGGAQGDRQRARARWGVHVLRRLRGPAARRTDRSARGPQPRDGRRVRRPWPAQARAALGLAGTVAWQRPAT